MGRALPDAFATPPPTPDDIRLARELRQRLTAPSSAAQVRVTVQVEGQAPTAPVVVTAPVLDLMLRVLAEVSQGRAVAVAPIPLPATAIPGEEERFAEQFMEPLSDRDRDLLLDLLDHPPPPNEALREAARLVQGRD